MSATGTVSVAGANSELDVIGDRSATLACYPNGPRHSRPIVLTSAAGLIGVPFPTLSIRQPKACSIVTGAVTAYRGTLLLREGSAAVGSLTIDSGATLTGDGFVSGPDFAA